MNSMITKTIITTVTVALATLLAIPAAQAQGGAPIGGSGAACQNALIEYLDLLPVGDLEPFEENALRYLREEEKLARDLYLTLSLSWELPIFSNIARSEQRHMDLVALVMARHELADPVGDNAVGVFTDPTLAALYDQLLGEGQASLVTALEVGAWFEETDLADLAALGADSDELDIDLLVENLAAGTRNHLRAFVGALEAQGVEYQPQQLDPTTFAEIISSDFERGVIYDEFGEVLAECGGPRQANGINGYQHCDGAGGCDGDGPSHGPGPDNGTGNGDGNGDGHHGDDNGNDDTGSGGPHGDGGNGGDNGGGNGDGNGGDCDGSGPNGS